MQQLGMAVGAQIALSFANLELRETLRLQALRDPLTGLFNRRFLDEWIEREINRADHAGATLGVIMADVDHFKDINDVHGHDAGDQVLIAVANAIRGSLRAGDVPCRYGGEEFLILLTDITLDDLLVRAEELKTNVSRCSAEHRGVLLPAVTLSVGVALYPLHGSGATDVIKAADTALYAAKHGGRNRVSVASNP
jgi:diguanylate cyclase (GGDEF)-like protein